MAILYEICISIKNCSNLAKFMKEPLKFPVFLAPTGDDAGLTDGEDLGEKLLKAKRTPR